MNTDSCSYMLSKFVAKRLAVCVNPSARNSRLYWMTELGRDCQKRLCQDMNLPERSKTTEVASVNWELYGWTCYKHRGAIIRVLAGAMRPADIKRKLRQLGSNVRISSNNIRDIVKLFLQKGIVRKVFIKKKAHPRYELTEVGIALRELLMQAETPL